MEIGELLKKLRTEKDLSLDDVAKQLGLARQTLYKYETGLITNIPLTRIEELAKIYNVTPGYIMGWEDENEEPILENIPGIITPVQMKRIPILGVIACGDPIFAQENYDGYFMIDKNLPEADFILRAKGDSMIEANIFNGDLVFLKKTNDVDNGRIAAVLIDDEATLKRVNKDGNTVVLQPCNKNYKPIIIHDSDDKQVLILGEMVGVYSKRSS
ncbi:MAG: transcriptional repressor LexA [Peptoniphilaceae bacterium]|nr:transcriptional repressor LexA [Peptoniphilaceae bacterium]